jgi:glyoxylase-like metal-dependent hydrolase (beta-lactamase superfamily II)
MILRGEDPDVPEGASGSFPSPAMNPDFYLKQMEVGPMQNFVYLIGDRRAGECVVVDPAWDVDGILKAAAEEGLKITGALLTHTHYDHVNGVQRLLELTDAKVYVNKAEKEFLAKSRADATGIFINVSSPNLAAVSDADRLRVGKTEIQFIHTPGHTPGSQCFLVENGLVSGDTLFIGYCGRCDLPGGDPERMYESLTGKLAKLDSGTVLYPGHNYSEKPTALLGEEKASNPYLKAASLDEFYRAMGALLE